MSVQALLDEVVRSHLKNLKLPAIARILPEVAREARQGGWPLEEGLRVLLEAELAQRAENVARERLRAATRKLNRQRTVLIGGKVQTGVSDSARDHQFELTDFLGSPLLHPNRLVIDSSQ